MSSTYAASFQAGTEVRLAPRPMTRERMRWYVDIQETVQVDDGRAGLRCADCGVRDLLRGGRLKALVGEQGARRSDDAATLFELVLLSSSERCGGQGFLPHIVVF